MTWFRIGDIEIARIVESEAPFLEPHKLFREATPEALAPHLSWLQPRALCSRTGRLILPIQSYVMRTRRHLVLIDSCVGNDKTVEWFPAWHKKTDDVYLRGLRDHGIRPEEIDFVLCTHLHVDHSGWNTQMRDGRWVPTFPNARHLFAKPEFEYAERQAREGKDPTFDENVAPVMDAGLGVIVDIDHRIDDEIWLDATPGHTPGHSAIHVESRGAEGVVTGDLIHSPLQCLHPEWAFRFDDNPELARLTRRCFLERYADTATAILATHFPSPSVGHVRSDARAFHYEFWPDGAA
ncbi:MAG: MBL fold metallo-hydrolase [Gammaproteobacteria bacterium]|nr:MBL fold metallo-hydrolase [Gammaproteobacteria bacterium]